MVFKESNFRKLGESETILIGYLFEDAYVINKLTQNETYVGSFYGDPYCGIISKKEDWCLFGGVSLILWKNNGQILAIQEDDVNNYVCGIRQTSSVEAEFYIDPHSDNASVWSLNIDTLEKHKISTLGINDTSFPGLGKINNF